MDDVRTKIFVSTAGFRYRFNGHQWVSVDEGHAQFTYAADETGRPMAGLGRVKGRFEDPPPPPRQEAVTENRIIKAQVIYIPPGRDSAQPEGYYVATVTKQFAPQHGGGTQEFTAPGRPNIHVALYDLQDMATTSPACRTDLEAKPNE